MPQSITKTTAQIFKENIFTLFNLLNFIIAVMLFAVGAYSNMVFIAIILINIAVGIIQECKAKKLVDNLSILNRPHIKVLRDGEEKTVELSEIVSDDVLVLESGQQICNDAEVIWGMIEVNESLLTGESDAVVKEEGGELYSGSSVISGKCYAKVTHVGSENYATKLAEEVKKEKKIESELLGSKGDKVHELFNCSARCIAVFGGIFASRQLFGKFSGSFICCSSWYASEGVSSFDICIACEWCHLSVEEKYTGAEYLCIGDIGACRRVMSG